MPIFIEKLLEFLAENNPWAWLGKSLGNLYNAMVYFLVQILAKPPRINGGNFLDNIYSNMWGIGIGLSALITFALLALTVFSQKARLSFIEAAVMFIVISGAAAVLFVIFESAVATGDSWSASLVRTLPMGKSQFGPLGFTIDGALSPLLFIFGYGFWLLPLGAANMVIVFFYELFNTFIKFAILPSLALRPLGEKYKMWSNFLITGALVSMLFGRPLMVACISLANYAGSNFLGGTLLGKAIFLGAGMGLSIFLQFKLWQTTERTVARVSNAAKVSRITGTVNTRQTGTSRVVTTGGTSTNRFVPVLVTSRIGDVSKKAAVSAARYGKTQVSTGLRQAIASGAAKKAAAAAAGVATGGTATAATIAATTIAAKKGSAHMNKKQLRSLPPPTSPSTVSGATLPPPNSGMVPAGSSPLEEYPTGTAFKPLRKGG